jgi:RimJ/RimL family protein N-acetyltransferase
VIALRPAAPDDCAMVWAWANDALVRASSFHPDFIPWEDHQRWFRRKLDDAHCQYMIVLEDAQPVGQLRFEACGGSAVVHISLSPHVRGRGVGGAALGLACPLVRVGTGVGRIVAHVKPDNVASLRMFMKAGFRHVATVRVDGHLAEELVLDL